MENPGGSESLEVSAGHIDGPLYLSTDMNLASQINNTALTKAKPDRTQYQVMRLMNFYNWNYVRVLNLSDIRTTSSTSLIDLYTQLNDDHLSIFSDVRNAERIHQLRGITYKPVIVAWGTSDGLRDLANLQRPSYLTTSKAYQGINHISFCILCQGSTGSRANGSNVFWMKWVFKSFRFDFPEHLAPSTFGLDGLAVTRITWILPNGSILSF